MSNNPLSVDIKDILVAGSIGVYNATDGWAIFVGLLKDQPNTAIGIIDIGGSYENTLGQTDNQVRAPEVQVLVRGTGYSATWQKAQAIQVAIEQYDYSSAIGSYTYGSIVTSVQPFLIERDNRKRTTFQVNFRAIRQLT